MSYTATLTGFPHFRGHLGVNSVVRTIPITTEGSGNNGFTFSTTPALLGSGTWNGRQYTIPVKGVYYFNTNFTYVTTDSLINADVGFNIIKYGETSTTRFFESIFVGYNAIYMQRKRYSTILTLNVGDTVSVHLSLPGTTTMTFTFYGSGGTNPDIYLQESGTFFEGYLICGLS